MSQSQPSVAREPISRADTDAEPSAARERPILFSAPMVRALLAGTKTQTRRIVKPQPTDYLAAERSLAPQALRGEKPKHLAPYLDSYNRTDRWCWWDEYDRQGPDWIRCPYGVPGDTLWVREAWGNVPVREIFTGQPSLQTSYRAGRLVGIPPKDGDYANEAKWRREWRDDWAPDRWRPSIHMPRNLSRISLRITDVRVERLNEISDHDAEAEGCPPCPTCHDVGWINSGPDGGWQCTAPGCGDAYRDQYRRLWENINGPGSWAANPWVWAVSFDAVGPLIASPQSREAK